eukprot:1437807-Pyramimonas_sp.AAC.1
MVAAALCEPCHWGLRWRSMWGHDTCDGCAEMAAVVPCEPCHWGLRGHGAMPWGHEALEGRAK